MVTATFRFYEELNDFLPPERRKREFAVPCARAATAKHMIEALGGAAHRSRADPGQRRFRRLRPSAAGRRPGRRLSDVRGDRRHAAVAGARTSAAVDPVCRRCAPGRARAPAADDRLRHALRQQLPRRGHRGDRRERRAHRALARPRALQAARDHARLLCARAALRRPAARGVRPARSRRQRPDRSRCASPATPRCMESTRRWCWIGCRHRYASDTTGSAPAIDVAGCSGKARIGRCMRALVDELAARASD